MFARLAISFARWLLGKFSPDDHQDWLARRVLVALEHERQLHECWLAGVAEVADWKRAQLDFQRVTHAWMTSRKTWPNRAELLALYRASLTPDPDAAPVGHDEITRPTRMA